MSDVKSKILIVEDDLDVAEMLNAYLGTQGYEVFAVNWGEDGIRACHSVHPDAVVLDIRLPDIDGFEVAKKLRTDRRTQDIPIIFLTEKRERADRLQGLELGADDYLTKPFDVQELRLRLRNVLTRKSHGSLTNPITGMPEGSLVDEQLEEVLKKADAAVLLVSLEHMDSFREAYGFVASDDVLRAVSLMVTNTLQEAGGAGDFVGHLSPTEFLMVTSPGTLDGLKERLRTRLEQSLDYFYPIKDRPRAAAGKTRLGLRMADFESVARRFDSPEQLKLELIRRKK